MAEIIITKTNYKNCVLESKTPVLLDFRAEWCGPCRMISPIIADIAQKFDGVITVGKVNVDEQPEIADANGITSIPTLVFYKDGKAVLTSVGYRSADDIAAMIKKAFEI